MEPGDILCVNRASGYQHFGIYAGNDRVIHYAGKLGDFGFGVSVQETSLQQFEKYDKSYVYELPYKDFHYSKEDTLKRAISQIGETKYDLLFNNCEHFVLWCRTGIKQSKQISDVAYGIAEFGVHSITNVLGVLTKGVKAIKGDL
jgi:cell wall-associated NlpC family hydrolase